MSADLQNKDSEYISIRNDLLAEYQRTFREAEEAIKIGEMFPLGGSCTVDYSGMFVPAINELRYAGKHMGDFALSDNIDDLNKAIFHCERAKIDVYDCLIQYCLRDIRLFLERYKLIVISNFIENYYDIRRQINDVRRKNDKIPVEYDKDTIRKSVNERIEDYKILKNICEIFDASRDILDFQVCKERNERYSRILGIGMLLTGVALIITFIFSVLRF